MALRRLLAFTLVLSAACSSSTAPHGGTPHPGVSFVTGNQQTDTVMSVLNQALVVQIRSEGAPAAGVVVRFVAVSAADSASPYAGDWVYPEPLSSDSPSGFVAETTNTSGEAAVGIVLGQRIGNAPLIVQVPQLGYVDTATFTVTVGSAAALRAGPADTAAYVNAKVTFHSSVTDRYGNPRTDPVTYAVLSGPAHVSGAQITPTAIGQVAVTATADRLTDTSYITVVPSGTLAGTLDAGGVVAFNLDGSNYQTITTKIAGTVTWAPSGSSLAFDQTSPNGGSGGTQYLFAVTTGGTASILDNSGGPVDAWPAYSRDGTWIYYCKFVGGTNLWRVHPDGTGDSVVTMQAGSPLVTFPSPSPDGTQIVYAQSGYGTVQILTLSTGVSTQLGSMQALSASWSPNSNVIAIDENGPISLIHSDGTGLTVLTTNLYEPELAWSPDGNWIAARNAISGKIDLLNVTTPGLVLTLPYTGGIGSPTWH